MSGGNDNGRLRLLVESINLSIVFKFEMVKCIVFSSVLYIYVYSTVYEVHSAVYEVFKERCKDKLLWRGYE